MWPAVAAFAVTAVVVWCRTFAVGFGAAPLRGTRWPR